MSQYNENDPQLDELLAEPPMWPKEIGIISIVWGSLGWPVRIAQKRVYCPKNISR